MKNLHYLYSLILLSMTCCSAQHTENKQEKYPNYSGIYPHLAFYNSQGECGTGAVVPWAGKLWAITYSPHEPNGSDDKLYEIDENLNISIRSESIGGTPANRMIHNESNQLFLGPYVINNEGTVRVLPYTKMPGRHTGNARHLNDPSNKIYYGSMEEGFYEVDVHTLEVTTLYPDGNGIRKTGEMDQAAELLPGAHGKGLYSGQGVMIYSNNGEAVPEALKQFDIESGALAEWDGKDWTVVRRDQFVEVTGPGGIQGNRNPETDPIWATGFDHKSLLVGVREHGIGWSFYRLPKASHSYDGAHGWNTEWPRIRDIGAPEKPSYLMTMHGMFWDFPGEFGLNKSAGIRPKSAYLKVIGDFTRWNDQLVFGCDDSAQREFLNKRSAKGGIEGPGQSNSNLWFTSLDQPNQLGPNTAVGALWLNQSVEASDHSEPFLFNGWDHRTAWLKNHGENAVLCTFEVDRSGDGTWEKLKTVALEAGAAHMILFGEKERGEWIRARVDKSTKISLEFTYHDEESRSSMSDDIFDGLSQVENKNACGGLLYGLGDDRRKLGISTQDRQGDPAGYYELDSVMHLYSKDDAETQQFIESKFAIPKEVISVEESSILVIDDSGRRWRLPKGNMKYDQLIADAKTRICREVATERDLFHAHGTFYELPAENADGYAKIRPIASHNFRIHDYASYRGMLIISGLDPKVDSNNPHIITSNDGELALWAGVIDDLWKLGKPVGEGGPLLESVVEANIPSDPYLIGFYDQRKVALSHENLEDVEFIIEVNPIGHGPWMLYRQIMVPSGETVIHEFPIAFEARWVRVIAKQDCIATSWFTYE